MEQFKDFKHIVLIEENELRTIIAEELSRFITLRDFSAKVQLPKYVYGLKGIAELFNCSVPTANHIKSTGRIAGAVSQCG